MTSESKTTGHPINTISIQARDYRVRSAALKVVFFAWNYFEMMLAMGVGATLFERLVPLLPASTRHSLALYPGTFQYISGISLAMMFVMIAWMIIRGHGWRHSAEMAVAMLVAVALAAVISSLKGGSAWFDNTYCAAMCVGMLASMLYRWDHFTTWLSRSTQHIH